MHRRLTSLSLTLLVATCGSESASAAKLPPRTFSFRYHVEVKSVEKGSGAVDVFVPVAVTGSNQEVIFHQVTASLPGAEGVEPKYGNRFWHGHLDQADGRPITVTVNYQVKRWPIDLPGNIESGARTLSSSEREKYAIFLSPNQRVPISGEPIDTIVAGIAPGSSSLAVIAKASFDYVVDNMEYKKVSSGWGNGDTFWACSQKYGNCTDFHALFISLGRARGIPARFQIGFPIPLDRDHGEVNGYHCWVEFYLPQVGWLPLDASEAKKHPEQRENLFGAQPADRIQFSVGRDLQLGTGHRSGALNYFIYPLVEVAGKRVRNVTTNFSYQQQSSKHLEEKFR